MDIVSVQVPMEAAHDLLLTAAHLELGNINAILPHFAARLVVRSLVEHVAAARVSSQEELLGVVARDLIGGQDAHLVLAVSLLLELGIRLASFIRFNDLPFLKTVGALTLLFGVVTRHE